MYKFISVIEYVKIANASRRSGCFGSPGERYGEASAKIETF